MIKRNDPSTLFRGLKQLLSFLVIVYLNSGRIIKYPEANLAYTSGSGGGLFSSGSDTTLYILNRSWGNMIASPDKVMAIYSLASVEHWETKDDKAK